MGCVDMLSQLSTLRSMNKVNKVEKQKQKVEKVQQRKHMDLDNDWIYMIIYENDNFFFENFNT